MESAKLYGNMNKYAYYFTDLLIGSPTPQRTSVIVDTGSRLVGFPCKGCDHCGDHLDPAFDIGQSSTAKWLRCGDGCVRGCVEGQCAYRETYSEGSTISGRWFDDLVELGDSFQKNPPVHARLGCHTNENKLFYTQRANGIMGLAPSSDGVNGSRPTVLQDLFRDKSHVSTEIFSMCLATWGGRLTVGGYDTSYHRPGQEVQWTPMRAAHYYFVFPEGLALLGSGGVAPKVVAMTNGEFGVTIIDSGTTYTYFPGPVFRTLVGDLLSYCDAHGGCSATREGNECFRLNDVMGGPDDFPVVKMTFKGGAQIDWSPYGYLHQRGEQGVWCQTFMENHLYQTVLGISWMIHQDVIFDLQNGKLGVAKANCPEHHKDSDYLQRDALVSAGSIEPRTVRRPVEPLLLAAGFVCLALAAAGWATSVLRSWQRAGSTGGGRCRNRSRPAGGSRAAVAPEPTSQEADASKELLPRLGEAAEVCPSG